MGWLIRELGRADLDALVGLVAACFEPAWSRAAIEGALADRGARTRVATAAVGGEGAEGSSPVLVGFVLARRILDEVEIDLVGVVPALRRQGLGVRLLEALLEDERRAGARVAQLELSAANAPAAALYASLGFVVVGRRPRYYPDGSDALLLSSPLDADRPRPPREIPLSIDHSGSTAPPPPARSRARVLANRAEGHGRRLRLAVPGWTGSTPGQFLMIGAGAEGAVVRRDPLLPRPMAVYRELGRPQASERSADGAADERVVELLYRVVGRGTALIGDLREGERVPLVGPLGRGFDLDSARSETARRGPALLVGGGTGIASLYEWARALAQAGRAVSVLLGARSRGDLLGWSDFEALGVELIATTEDGSFGQRGLVTLPLAERLRSTPGATVYAVGPTPMMRACAELAEASGAACFVSLENPMACGFGVCLGCAAPRRAGGFALVCRNGPVFAASEIDWAGLP